MNTATTYHSDHDPHWGALALIIAATALTAAIGGLAAVDAPAFYGRLTQPSWAPPARIFGPVWTVLFVLMCAAAWLVVRSPAEWPLRPAMNLFAAQLVANAAWTWLFFRWNIGSLAFFDSMVLLVLVVLTARAFWRRRRAAGWLMLPYIAWTAFAAALTFAMWQLNPGLL